MGDVLVVRIWAWTQACLFAVSISKAESLSRTRSTVSPLRMQQGGRRARERDREKERKEERNKDLQDDHIVAGDGGMGMKEKGMDGWMEGWKKRDRDRASLRDSECMNPPKEQEHRRTEQVFALRERAQKRCFCAVHRPAHRT